MDKIKNGCYVHNLLDAILLPVALAVIKVPGHSRLNSLGAKVNHLADIATKNTALKETNSQTLVMVQRDIPPSYYLGKLIRDTQQLAPEKEKQYWKSSNCCFNKKRMLVWIKLTIWPYQNF